MVPRPDDCDGPEHPEECVFIGPFGAWYDFQCEPKDPARLTNRLTGTPADPWPELAWHAAVTQTNLSEDLPPEAIVMLPFRRLHSIYPLCEMVLGEGVLAEEVQFGWLAEKTEL